ncbi:sulfite exporter TauE/SafE family protein [Patescibacteria group bacterium]
MNTIWIAFITGLTTGGISCFAVQGGLLASAVSEKDGVSEPLDDFRQDIKLVGIFLLAKLFSHTLLGLLLGFIGSAFILSPGLLAGVQIFVGVYMILTALRLLNVHPVFRYTVITPPRSVYKFLKNKTGNGSIFAPLLLGFFTVLIPCGITQAMMVYAVSSSNPLLGAGIMGAFVIGTSPIFLVFGAAMSGLLQNKALTYAAAIVVLGIGLSSINGGMVLTGSIYTFQNFYRAATTDIREIGVNKQETKGQINDRGEQVVNIKVLSNGYEADVNTLKAGVPVRLKLTTQGITSCARAFVIPEFGLSKILPATGEDEIVFTPQKTGRLAFSCSMGMYTGEFTVK